MSAPWAALCRNFDDDALAALASVGLLRRAAKDVEAGKVAWDAPPGGDGGTFRVDGQRVAIGARGPAAATCDCPAPGICKHVLAAVLWLRTQDAGADGIAGLDGAAGAAPATPDVLAEVLALDRAAVLEEAGRAATRKAAALFANAGAVACETHGGALLITLPELDFACRYIGGGGLAGIVSEAPAASRKALHLLALAATWHAHGHAVPWPADDTPAQPAAGLTPVERDFLAHARHLVLELCGIGWSHLPDIAPTRLRALGTSARIESFPRLAGMLRDLAGSAALLQRRDPHTDERDAIGLAARIHALCTAIEHADGEVAPALRGSERRSFSGGAALELLPLGGHWWERRGGARGLALPFWDPAGSSVVQAVLARRDNVDRSFTRRGAWTAAPLWPGVPNPAALADGTWALREARLSPDGRIGIGGATRAEPLPPWRDDDPRWLGAGFDDWAALRTALRAGAGLAGGASYVLLRPAGHDAPRLREARQLVTWTLQDRHRRPLALRIPCDSARRARIAHLETWIASGSTIAGVVAAVERDEGAGWLEPVSLVIAGAGNLRPVALDYEAAPGPAVAGIVARLTLLPDFATQSDRQSVPAMIPAASPHARRIGTLLAVLEHHGMTGRYLPTAREREQVDALRRFWLATGLDVLVRAIDAWLAAPGAATALMLVHLCRTALALQHEA